MGEDCLLITDKRTGKTYEIPIHYGTFPTYGASIRGADLRNIKASEDDFGLISFDPAFINSASRRSAITFIDGERGILRYRGYPIEALAEQSNYMEVAYLLVHGELPTEAQHGEWSDTVIRHSMVHENMKRLFDAFHYDAHPMSMLISSLAALSSFYSASRNVEDPLFGRFRSTGSSGRSLRSRLWLIGIPTACPTSCPTTTSPTSATS
jgi:citrate synthase